MKQISLTTTAIVAMMSFVAACAAETSSFSIDESDEGLLIKEGDANVLFYQRKTKSLDGRRPRANYIHPLYDLDGNVLTEDFPDDHLHHRGIFWAWHQLWVGDKKIGDGWVCQDFSWDVREVQTAVDNDSAALRAVVHWKSPQWTDESGNEKPLIEETTVIRAHRSAENSRNIDFEIRLRALEDDLRLGGSEDQKGYGGFSVRIKLPDSLKFFGEQGELAPQVTPLEASRWLDMTAAFEEGAAPSGVAVLCHPSLPGFPQHWILRQQRSMQNPVFPYPGREAVPLSRDEPTILRYRLVIHRGDTEAANIAALQKQYEDKPLESFAGSSR